MLERLFYFLWCAIGIGIGFLIAHYKYLYKKSKIVDIQLELLRNNRRQRAIKKEMERKPYAKAKVKIPKYKE